MLKFFAFLILLSAQIALGDNYRNGNLQQGQAMPMVSKTVLLVADNTAVDVGLASLLLVGSDNTTATNRTFTLLASPIVGHKLLCLFQTGASTSAELADTGIQKLSAGWTPVQYGTLELVSDGTNWIEVARSAN